MCLILFAHAYHPEFQLIIAANRDEFYSRPTQVLSYWDDVPSVLAGRDLKNMGTWLGVTKNGRIAAITNYRDPSFLNPDAPSRGLLVSDFLTGDKPPKAYLEYIEKTGQHYNAFNLLVGQWPDLYYASNRGKDIQKIRPGLYGLSNDLLDTPWPKITKGKKLFKALLDREEKLDPEAVFNILGDRAYAPDSDLPHTGVGEEWERILSPLFITSMSYGTRCSSIVLFEKTGRITFLERTFEVINQQPVEQKTVKYVLDLDVG